MGQKGLRKAIVNASLSVRFLAPEGRQSPTLPASPAVDLVWEGLKQDVETL